MLAGVIVRPESGQSGRAARIFTHAERVASITPEHVKIVALAKVAEALAATNPDRATLVFTDAERITNYIIDESAKASALRDVAKALAATSS
jgi:hypothetical protein